MNIVEPIKIKKEWCFKGDKALRKASIEYPYEQWMIDEIYKCANGYEGLLYWVENYAYITTLKGIEKCKLYPFQYDLLHAMYHNRFSIACIARQSGKTTIACLFFTWIANFHDDEKIGAVANKQKLVKEIIKKIKIIYTHMPFWMKQGITELNKTEIEFENGSRIVSDATSDSSLRGFSVKYLYWDEVAFIKPGLAEDFLSSVYPTISSNPDSKIIQSSTPFGFNHFAKTWFDAKKGLNDYVTIEADWTAVPGRTEKFKKDTITRVGLRIWKQDFEINFLGSDLTLIDSQKLATLSHDNPIYTSPDDCLKIYKKYEKGHTYGLCFDSCTGDGQDYHGVHLIDITKFPYEQVLTYRNNTKSIHQLSIMIHDICMKYPGEIFIVGENNGLGRVVLEELLVDLELDAYFFTEKKKLGVYTTQRSKSIGCATLKDMIETDKLLIHDYNTIQELFRFVNRNGKFKADEGDNSTDDLVMALVVFFYVTTTRFYSEYTEGKYKEKMLERIEDDETIVPFGVIDDGGMSNDIYSEDQQNFQIL